MKTQELIHLLSNIKIKKCTKYSFEQSQDMFYDYYDSRSSIFESYSISDEYIVLLFTDLIDFEEVPSLLVTTINEHVLGEVDFETIVAMKAFVKHTLSIKL